MLNLLSNAVKFTDEGGAVEVTMAEHGDSSWRLQVRDTGIGIAAADLPRLFEAFTQLDSGPSRQHDGTGLGLALTRKLVELQGGRIDVQSRPGTGSTFSVLLPRVAAPAAS